MLSITLAEVLACIMLLALNAYVLLGGADYGGGVWDALASGPRRVRQRALIAHAIGPIWEANHVWLILCVVLLFTCFPAAFARIVTELHVPLTLMLVGVVLRGSAFIFRTYDSQRGDVQRRWGLIFALSSIFTPAMLGIVVGALATGAVGKASQLVNPTFAQRFVLPWLNPFVIGVGVFALALFAFLAAVYLTVESGDDIDLQNDFRRRALGAEFVVFICAFGTQLWAGHFAPSMRHMLTESSLARPLQVATGAAAIMAIAALIARRHLVARVAAAAQVSLILWGWGIASFPYLVPPTITIESAAAPPITLRLTLIVLAAGGVVLVPSIWYLFRVFKSHPMAFDELEHEEAVGDVT
ncbi:MAG: cytochrome d ubiquinol oxidase subunit II [Gemmatimonadaceae bacterium]